MQWEPTLARARLPLLLQCLMLRANRELRDPRGQRRRLELSLVITVAICEVELPQRICRQSLPEDIFRHSSLARYHNRSNLEQIKKKILSGTFLSGLTSFPTFLLMEGSSMSFGWL